MVWFLDKFYDAMSTWLLVITWKGLTQSAQQWLYYLVLTEGKLKLLVEHEKEIKTLLSYSFAEFTPVKCESELWPLKNILKKNYFDEFGFPCASKTISCLLHTLNYL